MHDAAGDLGAEVIKVEVPGAGDLYRRQGPHFIEGESTAFLSSPEAREVMHRLVPSVDGVVENSRPGSMQNLGLGYEDLRALNLGLIYVSISGFGQTGPMGREGGYDLVLTRAILFALGYGPDEIAALHARGDI